MARPPIVSIQLPNVTVPVVDREGYVTRDWYLAFNALARMVFFSSVFDQLPTVPAVGMVRVVTDSNTTTWGATIAGGGTDPVLAWYNGTDWTVIGA